MWLLNAETHVLEWFADPHAAGESYAILSHTWDVEEISFQDIQNLELARLKPGYEKIQFTCDQALKDGLKYAWVDTCCIDKKSSAELSEAINSMFHYYRRSDICYVLLSDIQQEADHQRTKIDAGNAAYALAYSRWFTRGWTLQELIAPFDVEFFGRSWSRIGTKFEMAAALAEITSIDIHVLRSPLSLENYSVAQRMSWGAGRKTTRSEDRAYSLLGLFDVSMAPLYGEGEGKAFLRLQQEIMKVSDDQSILLWSQDSSMSDKDSLLALSPDHFSDARRVIPITDARRYPFEVTNSGIRIPLHVKTTTEGTSLVFNCRYNDNLTGPLALPVLSFSHNAEDDPTNGRQYNIYNRTLHVVPRSDLASTELCTCLLVTDLRSSSHHNALTLRIFANEHFSRQYDIYSVAPESYWNAQTGVMGWPDNAGVASDDFRGFIAWEARHESPMHIVLRFDFGSLGSFPHNLIMVLSSRRRLSKRACLLWPDCEEATVPGVQTQVLTAIDASEQVDETVTLRIDGSTSRSSFVFSVRSEVIFGEDVYTVQITQEHPTGQE